MSGTPDPVVCIVGAGPAGLVLGHLLLRAGLPFVLLERQEAGRLRERMRAGMLEHRSVVLLDGYRLADSILEHGRRVGSCEFRCDGQAIVLDYACLCGGRGHLVYPQHELVGEWAEQLVAAGADIRFGVEATAVEQDESGALVRAVSVADGAPSSIACDAVACCDGAAAFADAGVATLGVAHPSRWLTLVAAAPPSTAGTVYGLHPRGFAGQMQRSASRTRFMLEVPAGEGFDAWPEERIWAELQARLAVRGRPPLERGELVERDVLDLRVRVCEPMQDGRVYLTGDAAHLITPAGGKGMNLAIQDAVELARGLQERYGERRDRRRLERYSETRLPRVWSRQELSNLLLGLFSANGPFGHGLRRARLDQLVHDPHLSRWFARAYVGVDA